MTIFHRSTALNSKPLVIPKSQRESDESWKSAKISQSLKVRCPKTGETVEVRLVDANGKRLILDVVELLNVVRGAFGWTMTWNMRLMHSGAEVKCNSTENVLKFAGMELNLEEEVNGHS